ncbi:MAG: M13 family metallopeptidase [Pyrinomonadaceae bacterium]
MFNKISKIFVLAVITLVFLQTTKAQNSGLNTANMDKTVNACTDFFEFANGEWLKKTEIPGTESGWGTFNILAENNRNILKTILEKASEDTSAKNGSNEQLIGDFYFSCMDESAIESAGSKPLEPYFNAISRLKTKNDVQNYIAKMHNAGMPALFGFGGGADIKNSKLNIANARQGGLSLPNRDYYVEGTPKFQETRDKFRDYMRSMFELIGDSEQKARDDAFVVMKIQTRLAIVSLPQTELRNPDNRYSKVSVQEADKITPHFSWNEYMTKRGVNGVTEFNIGQPKYFEEMDKIFNEVSVEEWKTYLRWMTVDSAASLLSKKFRELNFKFYREHLQGVKEELPRWRTCVQATDRNLGEALGVEYTKVAFNADSKTKVNEMIDNLFGAFRQRLDQLEWMSETTKEKALSKLLTFKRKIGYPDKLRGYQGLDISRTSYFNNDLQTSELQIKRNIDDIGKPVDQTRWGMTPPTVNAYYSPVVNEIVFPAGILQPPFYNPKADNAINYGGIGAVIGHEMTHGFDDQGSRFDAEGNLKMWWTPDDRRRFEERAECVVKQFSSYEVQPGLFMNGKLTLGENIGDLGGLTMAYVAFEKSLEGKPRPANIDGLTPEQRFFLGWAQVWATKATSERERLQVSGDPHAIARFRVNGPMSNMPQFAKAFGCKKGDPMVRSDMCVIW